MIQFDAISVVHVEPTTRCNARCPQCARNVAGGIVNPYLPLTELSAQSIRKIFTPPFLRQLEFVYFCGTYGDPAAAEALIGTLEYFKHENPSIRLGVHSNGSLRSSGWWRELAGLVTYCRFGIDGVEDTNAIYRRGTSWPLLIGNVRAFIAAGGRAEWDFIVFRHNQHQVDQARTLANVFGFRSFNVKCTTRFEPSEGMAARFEVLNSDGAIDYYLQPPDDPRFFSSESAIHAAAVRSAGGEDEYLATTRIRCKAVAARKIFISAAGLVFPCCYLATIYRNPAPQILELIKSLPEGLDSIDATKHTLQEIIEGPFFQQMIPNGWDGATGHQRLRTCARVCGVAPLYS